MRKIFNLTSWVLLFTLAPFAVLALLSQNSAPGDLFYPVKRGLEGIVLTAASASPATRVAFKTDLTERRFKEAEKLLLAKADTTALDSFILEVQSTQGEIDALSNVLENQQSSEKLITKIDDYQIKLTQLQAQTQSSPASSIPSAAKQTNQLQTVQQSQTVVQQQTLPPSGADQAGQSAVQQPKVSTLPQPEVAVQNPPAQQKTVAETITTTKIELERIKKDLEEKKREREERKEEKGEGKEKRSERKK